MSASLFTMENRLARSWPSPSCPAKLLSPNGRTMTMKRNNILVIFDDETRVVYAPQSSVRIANRGPSDTRIKDYEQVQTRPPLWFGFQNFEARILAAGHQMLKHPGFRQAVGDKQTADITKGD